MDIFRYILHLIYPTKCPICGEIIGYKDDFCETCRNKINHYSGSFSPTNTSGFTAAFVYDDIISPAVILLKDGTCGNAAYALGKALAEAVTESGFSENADLIIPVPLHKKDKRERGYNQSELIAKEAAKLLKITVCTKAVVKHRKTQAQKTLTKSERKANLNGAFSITNPELISGKSLLIIDDVCTTGSTLAELAELLLKNGAARVYCASCCKTPIDDKSKSRT